MRVAELEWRLERSVAETREKNTREDVERIAAAKEIYRRFVPPGWLAFRTFASVLILVALTRPRSREFFEAAARPVSER
jgi:hypothetical protein